MRNLVKVIDEMIKVIPEENEEFISELKRIQSDQIQWTAPESMVRWEEISYTLQDYAIEEPMEEWQYKILSIWSMKSIDEIKESFKNN